LPSKKGIRKGGELSKGKSAKQETNSELTLDLLLLHLKGAAPGLDRLLKAVEGIALLLEGQLLARARDAEHH
jgi:hypothetical protein